ncbi:TonB-dependent receptor [Mucilaginibacter sp. UR6-1]|uniref:TonB-dependent receptor n=1 Tax=Mucilaginibacter sp. UR6-1 TaxID=1435643 RepID=UPI001E495CDF|nr:TonB-dependent receptor [Mucilaginibacter sp. UR6-1]MCC8410474.1 TonB-dependent receptor [Mucilaginibacter sp. UR6-1]
MKKLFTLITILLAFAQAFAQQQFGSVSGTVTTRDGSPAVYVSVGVKDHSNGNMTNDKGQFRIGRLRPGTYTLVVSAINLGKQEKEIVIKAGENSTENFVLDINNAQLQEVEIKEKNNKIKIDNPSQSLRLNEPVLEAAQNIQIVSNTAIRDQQIISMSDGLIRNVSGAVRLEHWGDLYTNITMRGSQIQAFRNGFNVVNSYWGPLTEDMSFVDHIEFVKGPAGFMVSNGDPAGLYNVVTKKPTGQTKGEFSLTGGSFGLYRATLDLDGKLSKDGKFLYRLNVAGQKKGTHREFEENNRFSIAPVVSYQFDDNTKLTFEYTYQNARMSDVGSYYVFGSEYAKYPVGFTQYQPGLPLTNINDHSAFLKLDHKLSDKWTFSAEASYFNYQQKGSSLWPSSVRGDTVVRSVGIWDAKSEMTMARGTLTGDITTGAVRHRILGGIDVGTKKYFADWGQSHALDTEADPFISTDPNYGTPSNGYPVWDRTLGLEARAINAGGTQDQQYAGFYAQDELGFLENMIRLTIAGRYTYVKQSSFGGDPISSKKVTPRLGLSVSVDKQTSFYGLYDQAFTPQAAARLINGGSVKPITGNNIEFGIKRDWFGGQWNTTFAIYQITKNNEATATANSTPANPQSMLLGQRRAKGIEFDLRGEILPGLTLTANYALTDSKVTSVGDVTDGSVKVGDVVPGYSKHTINGWLNYKLQSGPLKGSGISAGFTGLLDRATDTWSPSTVRLPDYFKIDAGLFWEGSKMRISGNVFNVANKYLYSGSYYSWLNAYYWQTEAPRNYRLSVSYRF